MWTVAFSFTVFQWWSSKNMKLCIFPLICSLNQFIVFCHSGKIYQREKSEHKRRQRRRRRKQTSWCTAPLLTQCLLIIGQRFIYAVKWRPAGGQEDRGGCASRRFFNMQDGPTDGWTDRQMDGRTDRHGETSIPLYNVVAGGINIS